MITVQLQTEIEAQPDVVFGLLADHTKHLIWNPNIIEASLLAEETIKKGSKGISVGESRRRRIENEIIYDEYDRSKFVSGGTTSGSIIGKMSMNLSQLKKEQKSIIA